MNHKLKPQDQDKEFFWQNLTTSSALESFFFFVGWGGEEWPIFNFSRHVCQIFPPDDYYSLEKYRQIYGKSKVI